MKKKSFSYKDISRLANVSISTVSRYYNGGYVSDATRKKIQEIVKKHDFYPTRGGRLLKGYDNLIFIIVPEWCDEHYSQIINGIQSAGKKRSKRVMVTYAEPDFESYAKTIKYVTNWKPDSIILFLPLNDRDKIIEYINKNAKGSTNIIFGPKNDKISSVSIDLENSFYGVTKKFKNFIEPNQKVIFVLDVNLSEDERSIRRLGFERACKELSIPYEVVLLANKDSKQVSKFLNYLRKENHVNVVCSTHDVYINLISSGDKNLRLTDIGYFSISDYRTQYKCKIFIDYPLVGMEMEKILHKISQNKGFDEKIEHVDVKPLILYKQ